MPDTLEQWAFEIWIWQHQNAGSFCSQLLSLFSKADSRNKARLAIAFPNAARAFIMWQTSENESDFYDAFESIREKLKAPGV